MGNGTAIMKDKVEENLFVNLRFRACESRKERAGT